MGTVQTAKLPLTPVEHRDPVQVKVPTPLLYFSLYYHDKHNSFARASETKEREIKASSAWNPDKDKFVAIEVTTEADFRAAWDRVSKLAADGGYVVAEGHLFTHASKPRAGQGGLEFAAIPGTGDGTITRDEVAQLARLPWRKTGELVLYGCNTGRVGEDRQWTPAQVFADVQQVKTIGTGAYSQFSSSKVKHVRITDEDKDVYLHPYHSGKNGRFGDGSAYPDLTFNPSK